MRARLGQLYIRYIGRVMNFKKMFRNVFIGLFVLCICGFGFVIWQIQSSLDEWRGTAQAAHPDAGDDVDALIAYVQSDLHTLRERNYAVWTLGRIRDGRALPILEGYLSGEKCEHDSKLCQKELKKAIELCKSNKK